VGLARPVAKWVHEVRGVDELGTIMRRAFHDAASAPAGPVFVSLPMSMLDAEGDLTVPDRSEIERRVVPAAIEDLAALLADTPVGSLAIVAGDEVSASGAVPELVALAEALGAPVFGAPLHSTAVFPPAHPLYAGMLAPAAAAISAGLAPFRRVLAVGGHTFMVYPYTPGAAVPDTVELLHISPDAARLGRTYPTRLGVVGDPKATLAALRPLVLSGVDASSAADTISSRGAARTREIDALEETALSRYSTAPMDPMAAGHALVRALPPNTTIVDEAITTGFYVRGFHHWTEPGHYFFCKGGGLGWGMPAALGVSLGRDREPVLCVVGDGSAMYSPQSLWTAAHEQLPVVFAVVNNRQYLILKGYLRGMGRDSVQSGRMVAMDIDDPPVDFVGLARSMGVDATLVEKADDVGDAVAAALEAGRPHLLELPIAAP
jgi:benzoylformate decarboxylase